jgi:hypothetical protein
MTNKYDRGHWGHNIYTKIHGDYKYERNHQDLSEIEEGLEEFENSKLERKIKEMEPEE